MSTPQARRNISKPNLKNVADGPAADGRGAHHDFGVTRRQDADTTMMRQHVAGNTRRAAKWISRMFLSPVTVIVFGVLLVWLTTGCVRLESPSGEQATLVGTDARRLALSTPEGWQFYAEDFDQSATVKNLTTGLVSGMAINAWKVTELGSQGVTKALSKDAAGVSKSVDGNATKVLINDSNNALKEAEILSGQ